jgi:hypothetical protein
MGFDIEDADRTDRLAIDDHRHSGVEAQVRRSNDARQSSKTGVLAGIAYDKGVVSVLGNHASAERILRRRADFRRALTGEEPLVRPPQQGDERNRRAEQARRQSGYVIEIGIGSEKDRHRGLDHRQTGRRLKNRGYTAQQWLDVVFHTPLVCDSAFVFTPVNGGKRLFAPIPSKNPSPASKGGRHGLHHDANAREVIGAEIESGP